MQFLDVFGDFLKYLQQGFKNFLRKLRGQQYSAPLTDLNGEPDAAQNDLATGSDNAGIPEFDPDNGALRPKEGCGGPGSMCCCPCGALKRGADGESKIKMEKVNWASMRQPVVNVILCLTLHVVCSWS